MQETNTLEAKCFRSIRREVTYNLGFCEYVNHDFEENRGFFYRPVTIARNRYKIFPFMKMNLIKISYKDYEIFYLLYFLRMINDILAHFSN